jgi:hypothetical protein
VHAHVTSLTVCCPLSYSNEKVYTHVTSAAEATRALGEAAKETLFRLLEHVAGQMSL